jgi:hypothetical protein
LDDAFLEGFVATLNSGSGVEVPERGGCEEGDLPVFGVFLQLGEATTLIRLCEPARCVEGIIGEARVA